MGTDRRTEIKKLIYALRGYAKQPKIAKKKKKKWKICLLQTALHFRTVGSAPLAVHKANTSGRHLTTRQRKWVSDIASCADRSANRRHWPKVRADLVTDMALLSSRIQIRHSAFSFTTTGSKFNVYWTVHHCNS